MSCVPPENKPTGSEIATCRRFLMATIAEMPNLRAIVVLGRIAHDSTVAALAARRAQAPFGHGASHTIGQLRLFDSYHCSRYNTNTGVLTTEMFRAVFAGVRAFLDASLPDPSRSRATTPPAPPIPSPGYSASQMAAKRIQVEGAGIVGDDRKARFNYEIGEVFEAGIALAGTEVKSLRQGKASIGESYADARGGELWLVNANIAEYLQAGRFNHAPKRARKLLLHRRQINKLAGAVEREGMTLVPLKLYFNEKGRAKIELALARGKKLHDKRETEKKRSWERERGRLMREKG